MIVVSDSSPLITLARAQHLELLREFYGQLAIPPRSTTDGRRCRTARSGGGSKSFLDSGTTESIGTSGSGKAACSGLGDGERSAIYLALSLSAEIVLIDEEKARRAAKSAGLAVADSIAILERGALLKKVAGLRSVYLSLLDHGIRFDRNLPEQSLARLALAKRKP